MFDFYNHMDAQDVRTIPLQKAFALEPLPERFAALLDALRRQDAELAAKD